MYCKHKLLPENVPFIFSNPRRCGLSSEGVITRLLWLDWRNLDDLAEGLVCWQVDIQKVWLLFSSVVLAFAFIFGNSIRQLYEAVILLFVIHPYDVGDWLMIGQAQYQVRTLL